MTLNCITTCNRSVETISSTLKLTNLSFNINEYTKKEKQHMKAVQLGA